MDRSEKLEDEYNDHGSAQNQEQKSDQDIKCEQDMKLDQDVKPDKDSSTSENTNKSSDRCRQSSRSFAKSKRGATALLITVAVLAAALGISAWSGAWQIFNRKSQSEMATKSDSAKLSLGGCQFYYGDMTNLDADGNPTGTLVTNEDALDHMNAYDAVMGRNDDTAIYIRMSITGEEVAEGKPITITFNRANTGELLGATDDQGLEYTVTDAAKHWTKDNVALYLSNAVSVKFMQISSLDTEDPNNADTVYKACKDEANWTKKWNSSSTGDPDPDSQPAYSFFSSIPEAKGRETSRKPPTELTKSNSFSATLEGYETTTDANGATTAVIFIRLDYEQSLVEVYLNENHTSMSDRLNQDVTEDFIGDISLIKIETSQDETT